MRVPVTSGSVAAGWARWSTPVGEYRAMGRYRLAAGGEARYAAPAGEYAYIEIEIHEVSTELALWTPVPRAALPSPLATHVNLVQHWFEEPKANVPAGRTPRGHARQGPGSRPVS